MSSGLSVSLKRPLDISSLCSRICDLPRFGRIEYSPSVDSTNALALERLYHNDSFGISFVTEWQREGRGRAGRAWFSPPGSGLLVSTILPSELPATVLSGLGFWAALAVREAVLRQTGLALALKWPNDLLLDECKCVGILAQGRSRADSSRVVLGVGINANRPVEIPEPIQRSAAWLSDAAGEVDRAALLATLLTCYESSFDLLLSDPQHVIAQWSELAALDGKYLVVKGLDGSIMHTGVARGIDGEGSLLLQTASGERVVRLGDVAMLN